MLYWQDFIDSIWSALALLAWLAGAWAVGYWVWLIWQAVGLN